MESAGWARGSGRETSSLAVHAAVPPVLDCIVAAVAESSGDLRPSLAHLIDHALDHQALLGGDGIPIQRGLQVLMESLPALLGRPVVHVLRNAYPVVGALLADQLKEQLILLRDPRSSTMSWSHVDFERFK
jgi:hypothetical protein